MKMSSAGLAAVLRRLRVAALADAVLEVCLWNHGRAPEDQIQVEVLAERHSLMEIKETHARVTLLLDTAVEAALHIHIDWTQLDPEAAMMRDACPGFSAQAYVLALGHGLYLTR